MIHPFHTYTPYPILPYDLPESAGKRLYTFVVGPGKCCCHVYKRWSNILYAHEPGSDACVLINRVSSLLHNATLQSRAVNDLHVDDQLPSTIINDQNTNTASAIREGTLDAAEQAALVDDWKSLLDITRFGHAHNLATIVDIQDTVLFEDRAEHGLDNDGWSRVADERALFVQLAGEEVDTKVAVLTGLRRHADTDDLRGTALEKEDIADANEMALDGHAGATAAESWLDVAHLLNRAITNTGWAGLSCLIHDHFVTATIVVVMVVGERVHDAVSSSFDTTAEAMILALVVVISHISLDWLIDFDLFFFDSDVGFHGTATFVFNVVGGIDASTVLSLCDVELRLVGLVVGLAAVVVNFDVVSCVSTVDFDVNVGSLVLSGCTVPMEKNVSVVVVNAEAWSSVGCGTYFSRVSSTSGRWRSRSS